MASQLDFRLLVEKEASPALLLPFLFWGELQNLITHSSSSAFEDFWPNYLICTVSSSKIHVLSGGLCCCGSYSGIGEKGHVKRAHAEGLLPTVQAGSGCCTFPAEQVLSCRTWMGWMTCEKLSHSVLHLRPFRCLFWVMFMKVQLRRDHCLWRGCSAVARCEVQKVVG